MHGLIFSVKRYSIHDGPGIRVTFFMKGCPLSCWWCHNPEGISPEQEMITEIRKIGETEFTTQEMAGKYYSAGDILEILEKERIFIEHSHGGVTFSGGEPLMQTDFLLEALAACKSKGYHTAVDTSGYSSESNFRSVMQYTDLFLYDIKHADDTRHFEYTGVSNTLILSNLRMLLGEGKNIFIRIPVIPDKNDDPESLEGMKKMFSELKCENLKQISLLPFHKTGKAKYRKLHLPYRMEGTVQPSAVRMKELKEFFEGTGIKVRIGA
jgi:pyruvate formate lyase activating enzyme